MPVKYAGFWKRLCAAILDVVVTLPVLLLLAWMNSISRELAMVLVLPTAFFFWFYVVAFHARFGATPGKMLVNIKVVRADDYADIGWYEASLRSSVEIGFAAIGLVGQFIALSRMSSSEYQRLGAFEREIKLAELQPEWMLVLEAMVHVWYWSEMIVLLFNRRKRAIHDFIAGTVVIHSDTQPPIARPDPHAPLPVDQVRQ